jgi:hypothetical protein
MERLRSVLALGLLAGVASASCVDASQRMATCPTGAGDGPAGAAALKSCSSGGHPSDDGLVDDFEDGDNQLSKVGGRDGYWFTSHDNKGSSIGPNPLKIDQGGAGTSKAMHVNGQTSGDSGAWGALFGANFASQGLYDASKYAGISFKAKVGASSTRKVRFKVGDVNTHPDGGVCKSCWNHFGKDLLLTTDWKDYQVTFAEMKQEAGWGEPRPAVTPSQLMSINWSIGTGQTFDVWIDDIQFFECI